MSNHSVVSKYFKYNPRDYESGSESDDDLSFEENEIQLDINTMDSNEYLMLQSELYCKHILEEDSIDYKTNDIYDELD